MRLLLDENFPADFAKCLVGHDVVTVHSLGWSGVKNGDLLRRAKAVCEVFVTLDRNLEFQQNTQALPFGIVVVRPVSSRMVHLVPHIGGVLEAVTRVVPGGVERVGDSSGVPADRKKRDS